MPIKWSALKVSEAMDMVEEFASKIIEPLESAKLVVDEAKLIPDLPQYIQQNLNTLRYEIERISGFRRTWSDQWYPGSIQDHIGRIRSDLPKGALESEQKNAKMGSQQSLV